MVNRVRFAGLLGVATVVIACTVVAQDPAEYDRAETAALEVSSWREFHAWFARYAAYDDGQIAVMNDGFVELQLSRHWETLPKLAKEAERDGEFLQFVLGHLGEGTPCEVRRQILGRAEKEPRPQFASLCRALAARLRESAPAECLP